MSQKPNHEHIYGSKWQQVRKVNEILLIQCHTSFEYNVYWFYLHLFLFEI